MTLNLKDPRASKCSSASPSRPTSWSRTFAPTSKARLGIDHASLRQINPRIVYNSFLGFWQDDPYPKRPGFDKL